MKKASSSITSLFLLLLSLLPMACKKECKTLEEYLHWLNNPKNNLVFIKYINGIEIKLKYLPPEYLTYLEEERDASVRGKRDSLLNTYRQGMTFLLTLGPDERKALKGDIATQGVYSYEQFSERMETMNFKMSEHVKMKTDKGEYKPVLTTMENNYGLTKSRSIYIVFVPFQKDDKGIKEAESFDVIYEDTFFDLGKNHFIFTKKDIHNTPPFTFWNK